MWSAVCTLHIRFANEVPPDDEELASITGNHLRGRFIQLMDELSGEWDDASEEMLDMIEDEDDDEDVDLQQSRPTWI